MQPTWTVKVYRMRKKNGREYPYIYLPVEFKSLIGKKLNLTVQEGKLVLEIIEG